MEVTQEELRAIVKFLYYSGKENTEIKQEIDNVYGAKVISLRTIQRYTKDLRDGTFSISDLPRSGRPRNEAQVKAVKKFVEKYPYTSCRNAATILKINKSTVKSILTKELQLHKVNFKWIPYQLTDEIRQKRVEIATELFNFLTACTGDKLNKVLTQDETWIYFENPRLSMWIDSSSEIPQIPKRTIGAKKVMVSVIWSRTGIKSITVLPKNAKFNKQFFGNVVLRDLSTKMKTKGKFFHCDNARPHNSDQKFKEYGLTRLRHPPYSPDIAPSDFFLFGVLKRFLEGTTFTDENQISSAILSIFSNLNNVAFKRAYDEWMTRLKRIINTNGEYIT